MAKWLFLTLAIAATTAVLEARSYEYYGKTGDLHGYVSDQRASSYNDYADRREREFAKSGYGQKSGGFGQQSAGFGQRPTLYSTVGHQPGFGQQPGGFGQQSSGFGRHTVYQPTVVVRNPPTGPYQNTGFGQHTGYARQYPGVYTPDKHITHLSVARPEDGYVYGL